MKKVLKILKKSLLSILIILVLLVFQAACDLELPEYTSKIVNIGIQQGGIEDTTLDAITEEDLNKIALFSNNEELNYLKNDYELITKENKNYSKYLKKYPILKDSNVYVLKNISKEERELLSNALVKPLALTATFSYDNEQTKQIKEQIMKSDGDIFVFLSVLKDEDRLKIIENLTSEYKNIEPSILTQMGISYIKSEYQKIGIDVKAKQINYIAISGTKMLGISLAVMAITIMVTYLSAKVASKFSKDLRSQVVNKIMNFSNKEYEEFSTASLITRSTNDIQQIQMLIVMSLRILIYAPILGLGALFKVTGNSMSWVIGVAVLSILSLIIILFSFALPKFKILQKLIDKINLVSREILTGLPVIRAFATEKHEEERFDVANKNLMKTNLFVNRIMTIMMPSMMFIMNGVSILIVWVGASKVDLGTMQVGTLMAFIAYTMQIIMSFLMISMMSIMIPRAWVSIKRIGEVFDKDISVKDKENPLKFKGEKTGVEFRDVYFRYPDACEDVLENISFKATPGTTTAFIGSTGSGKSTLINLIPRFFDVTSGKILIDGIDIRDVSMHDLRSKIGYVPQKGILFSGTIESNIAFGDQKISKKQIEKASKIAQAEEFIETKKDKYKSEISQGGTNVSGGQKQRLSIARAIAVNPDIYIFDDSFSALDYKTDLKLRKELALETKNSTILIVAQRISTVMHVDQIIVLDEGKIVGIGKHKELLDKCEIYKEIATSQLSKEELAHE